MPVCSPTQIPCSRIHRRKLSESLNFGTQVTAFLISRGILRTRNSGAPEGSAALYGAWLGALGLQRAFEPNHVKQISVVAAEQRRLDLNERIWVSR